MCGPNRVSLFGQHPMTNIDVRTGDREKLADADPPLEELSHRIRNWDVVMTSIKTEELLAELPTKRLLMRYTQGFIDRADPPGNLEVGGDHSNSCCVVS